MALDLYIKKDKVSIEHHEEELFLIINEDEAYPKLNWLWQEFYNSPSIEPDKANTIVHELINLRSKISGEKKHVSYLIDKLLPFFSKSFVYSEAIRCESD